MVRPSCFVRKVVPAGTFEPLLAGRRFLWETFTQFADHPPYDAHIGLVLRKRW